MSGPLYESGGRGFTRYFFLHGSHQLTSFPDEVDIEANVVSCSREGKIITGDNNEPISQIYSFSKGILTHVDGQAEALVPNRELVETLLKNFSVPALVSVEVPCDPSTDDSTEPYYLLISVLGRSDIRTCIGEERTYIARMMRVFAPRFTQAMAKRSEHYLPGDAPTLSREMARDIGASLTDADDEEKEEDEDEVDKLVGFLRLYRQRYLGKSVVGNLDVLEACLLHVLKMPFELASSVQQGLIRC